MDKTLMQSLGGLLPDSVYEVVGSQLMSFLLSAAVAILILVIGMRLVKYIVNFLRKIFEHSSMDAALQTFLLSAARMGLKILVFFMAVTELGVATSTIVAVVGSAGLALGLSLQGSLSNIAGGVLLLLVKPFSVGDYIIEDSSGKEGTVVSIGIMYTKLLTIDNRTIMVPNGNLSNATITNVTTQKKRRVDITVGVGYSEDIARVRALLTEVVTADPACLPDEPFRVYVNNFLDSAVEVGVQYWVNTPDYLDSRWRVLEAIKSSFDENGVSIPFPQVDVHMQ